MRVAGHTLEPSQLAPPGLAKPRRLFLKACPSPPRLLGNVEGSCKQRRPPRTRPLRGRRAPTPLSGSRMSSCARTQRRRPGERSALGCRPFFRVASIHATIFCRTVHLIYVTTCWLCWTGSLMTEAVQFAVNVLYHAYRLKITTIRLQFTNGKSSGCSLQALWRIYQPLFKSTALCNTISKSYHREMHHAAHTQSVPKKRAP